MLDDTLLQDIKHRFGIIGNAEGLNRAIERAYMVAPTEYSVLITGESGTGKEFFPKIVHAYSARKHSAYIAINCGAIPNGTIDSELFGHVKGAFTGAVSDHKGYFEEANSGTIFLDEVGELPLETQVRLLRVLEYGEYMRVGSSQVQKTNVRVVAATNVNLEEAIMAGKFREDLFYRLSTISISVPSLRERKADTPDLRALHRLKNAFPVNNSDLEFNTIILSKTSFSKESAKFKSFGVITIAFFSFSWESNPSTYKILDIFNVIYLVIFKFIII